MIIFSFRKLLVLAMMAALGFFPQFTHAQPAAEAVKPQPAQAQKPPKRPSGQAETADKPAAIPAAEPVPASELQPQRHAADAKITACIDTLARASSSVIDGNHEAFSFWGNGDPNGRPFRSILALSYANPTVPRGAAVIINGRSSSGNCDSTAIQVLPTGRSCSTVQNELLKDGKAIANLTGLSLIKSSETANYLLLPTAGGGCAVVAVNIFSD